MPEQNATALNPVMETYSRFPITLTKGKGSYVWDEKGKKYLDYTSGIAVCNLGHVEESVKTAVENQLNELWHCSNLYQIPIQEKLAELLVQNSCGDQVFFCNSGAEANEAAIKLARRYAKTIKEQEGTEIVSFSSSFHGRTIGAMSATGQEKIQQGFGPMAPGFRYLPYNDTDALEQLIRPETCAVLVELIQGEGGVIPADREWIKKLSRLCQDHDVLLIVDEIQTGIGRTGSMFAYEQYGIEPDVITVAKGLGNGIPVGAMVAKKQAAQAFTPGSHGSTFGGNPIAAAAGTAVLTYINEKNVLDHVNKLAAYLSDGLEKLKEASSSIKDIRGKGLLLGIVVNQPAIEFITKAREEGLLILPAGQEVVRVLPPLTTTTEEADEFLAVMKKVFVH